MKILLVSLLMSTLLFVLFFGFVEGNKQAERRMNALASLIYNNAETRVKLDSTALKQLVHLSTKGRVSFKPFLLLFDNVNLLECLSLK
jgi:hypothetical protein